MKKNRLQNENSDYLRQHADNPVDWYPWGEEAFQKSRLENKPIFLSSGYSSCHWCHVMEKESFSDPKIAELLNTHYVPIKLDREERPDVDALYMKAVQAMTGQGGWPLNIWLTPELRPFFGGTYFPPVPRHGQPPFEEVLIQLNKAFFEQKEAIKKNADSLTNILFQSGRYFESKNTLDSDLFQRATKNLEALIDKQNGGFGKAPKFFYSDGIRILLRQTENDQSENSELQRLAESTLLKLRCGGVFDQVAGGFHRYSTDDEWLVPHFEKMLYDNALMANVYVEAFSISQDQSFKAVAKNTVEQILEFCRRDMKNESGGFASAIDADTQDGEGHFYTWPEEELEEWLPEKHREAFKSRFRISSLGNFEGRNILSLESPLSEAEQADYRPILDFLRQKRDRRSWPLVDRKVQTGWNSLLITALARAGFVFDREDYLKEAQVCADFLWDKAWTDEGLCHHLYEADASSVFLLEDLAYFSESLLELFCCTGESRFLSRFLEVLQKAETRFYDSEAGGFWSTKEDQADVFIRSKDIFDSALPSAYSVMAQSFLRAYELTGESRYYDVFEKSVRFILGTAESQVGGFNRLALLIHEYQDAKTFFYISPNVDQLMSLKEQRRLTDRFYILGKDKRAFDLLESLKSKEDLKEKVLVCSKGACSTLFG